jgi:hypothetical protein
MVLAVHVIRQRAAHGCKSCPGCDREKPAARHDQPQYFVQRHAGFAAQDSVLLIECDESIQTTCQEKCLPSFRQESP